MLQVGVHDGDVRGEIALDTLDHRRGQPAPAEPADAAHAPIGGAGQPQRLDGAVGRVVVDEHDLPADAVERLRQLLQERDDVVALVEGGDDDDELGAVGSFRRRRLRVSAGA